MYEFIMPCRAFMSEACDLRGTHGTVEALDNDLANMYWR